jgi:phospholipase/carboxylesterase
VGPRLGARPGAPGPGAAVAPGVHRLDVGDAPPARRAGRRSGALLYVPTGYHADRPAPLAVMLHGAGGAADHGLALLADLADAWGLVLLAPASRGPTWDAVGGAFGADVAALDAALTETFARCAVDPARVALGGFSDGASYALGLGLANGDLFTHVLAFSPGYVPQAPRVGAPRCYVSHGTRDAVLPIGACSRRIVPALGRAGYVVRYREFDGPHVVPPDAAREAAAWLVRGDEPRVPSAAGAG